MNCHICFRHIDKNEGTLISKDIYLAPTSEISIMKAVHLICWHIRQVTTTKDTIVEKQPKRFTSHLSKEVTQPHICHVCSKQVTEDDPRIFMTPTTICMHMRCYVMAFNSRSEFCIGNPVAKKEALDAWSKLPKHTPVFETTEIFTWNDKMENDSLVTSPIITVMKRHKKDNISASDIKNAFRNPKLKLDITPVRKLCMELTTANIKTSVLFFLISCKFTVEDMISMGLTGDMLISDYINDWDVILDKNVFPVKFLVCSAIGFNFTNMLYAGLDIKKFTSSGYSIQDLVILGFNAPGFIAAGGTNEDKNIILKTATDAEKYEFGFLN